MKRTILSLMLAWLLTACVSFLPGYDEAVHRQLEAALADINKVGAAVALEPQPPFERIEPFYISALGNLRGAEASASGAVRNYQGSPAAGSAKLVAGAIGECRAAVERMMTQHRDHGLTRRLFERSNLAGGTCSIAVAMSARLRR
ncbi:MAG TPA: hypothetical protein VGW34_11295 [Allosphingosinicella sp.]|nr:hypothetical protein [Allosphingosinicella sp.]